MVQGSRSSASAVPTAVNPWASNRMAYHLSRSRGVGERIIRRCKSLASICHCSRNQSISLTPITSPSLTPKRANQIPHQIYRITLRISPWLWFRIGRFLTDNLKLEFSDTKTLVTHGRTKAARFLGYEVVVQGSNNKLDATGRRTINGIIGLRVPLDVVRAKSAAYMRNDKPTHLAVRIHDSPFSIVEQYQAEFRGVVNYYRRATNLGALSHLRWAMEMSLAKTLAAKLKISVSQVFKRYKTTIQTDKGPRKVLLMKEPRSGQPPLVMYWGGVSLARDNTATLIDTQAPILNGRTELVQRLLADTCELCGSTVKVQVHHIRAMKDLRKKGRAKPPVWVELMARRRRKTLVACASCHADIHAGRPLPQVAQAA